MPTPSWRFTPCPSLYEPAATSTACCPAAAASTAASTVRFGCARVPGSVSFPLGETKIDFAASPSIPSQLESTKRRSGLSSAPGWIDASLGPQSALSTKPSWSLSAGVGGGGGGGGGETRTDS